MGPKKKLSKKEKARLEAEQMELARIEMEKEKQKRLEEERERKQKERENAEKRQQQEIIENQIRRKQLKESVLYFDQIKNRIKLIREEEKKTNEWAHYIRCNGVPNTHNPGDLRKYLHIWNKSIEEHNNKERNWLLQTNERTLLTQDPDTLNLSREFLRKKQENLGDIYAKRIQDVLSILFELDETLEDNEITKSIEMDLLELKNEFRLYLIDFLNDFTYKILSHIERDMENDIPGMSKYIYISNVFKSQILAILGETQINQKDKIRDTTRHTNINFNQLEIQLSVPSSVKLQNSALRGLWLNYDHFSDYCVSYHLPKLKNRCSNIFEQTKKEWKKRKEILQSTIDDATKETSIHSYDSHEPNEPKIVDVDKIYTEYEDELNKLRCNEMQLNLNEFDVNLRRYRIIGGVYCIDYIEQPQQDKRLNAFSFIRTIFHPNKLKHKKFYQLYRPPPPVPAGVRRLPEEIEAEIKMIEQNLDKLAQVTVQLPNTVLWFEPPIVCRWEISEETVESELTEQQQQKQQQQQQQSQKIIESRKSCQSDLSGIKLNKILNQKKISTMNIFDLSIKEIEDFDLKNIPNDIDIFSLMTEFVVPRLPYGYCIRIEYNQQSFDNSDNDDHKKSIKNDENKSDDNDKKTVNKFQKYFKYLMKPTEKFEKQKQSIKDNLIETNSPRPLFPQLKFNRILKIKETSGYGRENQIIRRKSIITAENVEHIPYMFSELIQDLDNLFESCTSFTEDAINELSSRMGSVDDSESSRSIPQLSPPPPRKFSGIIIIRESDIPKDKINEGIDGKYNDESDDEESDNEIVNDDDDPEGRNDAKRMKIVYDIEDGKWSTRDVHDPKFNEDKLCMQFRTGRFGYFGFAANRYSNMPYQTWEIKPDMKNPGTIYFSLTAAVISLEMTITKDGFCITNFQGGSIEILNHIIGHTMSIKKLKQSLESCAINIFPDEDAFCYTEGSCEKNYIMEMHLYNCMSTLALSYNFSWSRWNLLSGSRIAVLLMREFIEGRKIPNHSTLYVTPLRAVVVDCTEVSASFSTVGIPGMEYYADLHHLTEAHSHPSNREKQKNMHPILLNNVADILISVRPLSFC